MKPALRVFAHTYHPPMLIAFDALRDGGAAKAVGDTWLK